MFVWEGLDGVEDVVCDESEVPLVAAGGGGVLILVSLVLSWKGFGYRHLNKVSAHNNITFFKQLPKLDGAQNSTDFFSDFTISINLWAVFQNHNQMKCARLKDFILKHVALDLKVFELTLLKICFWRI